MRTMGECGHAKQCQITNVLKCVRSGVSSKFIPRGFPFFDEHIRSIRETVGNRTFREMSVEHVIRVKQVLVSASKYIGILPALSYRGRTCIGTVTSNKPGTAH